MIPPSPRDRRNQKKRTRRNPGCGLVALVRSTRSLDQLEALALAYGEGVAQLEGAGIDVIALGSHGLAVDLDAAAVDIATSLAGARRKTQVLEQAGEVDLALVVNGQLDMLLGGSRRAGPP